MVLRTIPDFPQLELCRLEEVRASAGPATVLDTDRSSEPVLLALAESMGSRLVVPEVWRELLPQAGLLISSAISGGSLRQRFLEAAARSPRRCWLLLEPMRMEFPLPCPTGVGTETTMVHAGKQFFSEDLCCQYTHFVRNGSGTMVLWDTEDTLQKKLALARECGFLGFVYTGVPIQEIPS